MEPSFMPYKRPVHTLYHFDLLWKILQGRNIPHYINLLDILYENINKQRRIFLIVHTAVILQEVAYVLTIMEMKFPEYKEQRAKFKKLFYEVSDEMYDAED